MDATCRGPAIVDTAWSGEVRFTVRRAPAGPVELRLRVPGWCDAASVRVADDAERSLAAGSYTALRRVWEPGDQVTLRLPMPPRRLVSDQRVEANLARVSLARGPLIYCVESHDRPGLEQNAFALPDDAPVAAGAGDDRLPGMTLLDTEAVIVEETHRDGPLYQTLADTMPAAAEASSHPRSPIFRLGQSRAQHHGRVDAAAGEDCGLGTGRGVWTTTPRV